MSGDSPDVEQLPPDAAAVHGPSDRPTQRILIGSQRPGHAAEDIKAKPMTPPVTAPIKTQPAAAPPPPPAPTAETAPDTPAATAAAAPTPVSPPSTPPAPKKTRQHYPPPNIRDRLSPELEEEYLAALGDVSLDALMSESASGDTAAELAPETRVTGSVAKIHREDVFVDLGGRNQGVVPLRQFENAEPKPGAELELVVVRFDAEEGLYELARPTAAVEVGNWDEVREGQIIEVSVTGANKGGLECQVAGIRGFIPMGQVSIYRVENPEELVGQRLACVVTEANRDRRNLVLSHRAVMERERNEQRDKLLAELAPGQLREGVVRSLKDFGAFVDLGGVDGLVHVSQLSWDRVNHPSEVLEVGQKIKVRIEKFDKETGKVGLSYREVGANPWQNVDSKYPIGLRAKGAVSKLMDFGAFVKLEPGVEGLIHISELGHGRVFRVRDVLSEGQEVEVKIVSVDKEKQRIGLSLKALLPPPEKPGQQKIEDEDLPLPAGAPRPPRKRNEELKGGIGGPSGGEKFGLNW
jgi:small subunit ribosomal protein S1